MAEKRPEKKDLLPALQRQIPAGQRHLLVDCVADGSEEEEKDDGTTKQRKHPTVRSDFARMCCAKTWWGLGGRISTFMVLALSLCANTYSGIGIATQSKFDLDKSRGCAKLGHGTMPGYKPGLDVGSGIDGVVFEGRLFPVCGDHNRTNSSDFTLR